jgi:hypothetical protein
VVEMAAPIQSPAKCKVHSLIPFFNAKFERPAEIHKQVVTVYGDVMNRLNVMKSCRELSKGRTDVHKEQRSGRSYLISDELLQKTEGEIRANQRRMIRELHHIIPLVPTQLSLNLQLAYLQLWSSGCVNNAMISHNG